MNNIYSNRYHISNGQNSNRIVTGLQPQPIRFPAVLLGGRKTRKTRKTRKMKSRISYYTRRR